MASTFFGLNIAASALGAFQASVNTTANNVSNVKTPGYSRQEAILQAAEALRVNQKYGTAGSGVDIVAIKQVRDIYYDVKYWESNSKLGLYESRLYYSQQIEDYVLDDDTVKGFSTIMTEMFNALDTLKTSTGDRDKRQQFISKAQNLANYFDAISTGFSKIQDSCNQEINSQVANINSIAEKIASLNKQINLLELQGGYANELRDERALLVDELSGIVSVECTETKVLNTNYPDMYLGGTEYVVKINGQTLVNNYEYNQLECVAREYKVNQSDNDGLYDIFWKENQVPLATTSGIASGSLKALFETRDGNNRDNFSATVEGFKVTNQGTEMTLTGASIKDVKNMTMDHEGIIVVHNTELKYTGFSYDADTDTYTFQLEKKLTVPEQAQLKNKKAEIGTSIDAMGIPYYMAQMNTFVRTFCQEFNNMHRSGLDANGDDAGSFFVAVGITDGEEYAFEDFEGTGSMSTSGDSYYRLTAQNMSVANAIIRDPLKMATVSKEGYNPDDVDKNDLAIKMMDLKSKIIMFRGGGADSFLKCLISDNSIDTEKARVFCKNFDNLTSTIDMRRMSISGVDEDEEAMNLLKFQNAYNLASRMVQTMSEMYNRLILETGV
ncbi:MAG: flagellar hook-associated protein FlgK [Lachnospiraceae bacterium]|nr:flagellar hook-associated protein FlgK [Lachnospiraceae bacterium]